MITKRVIPCLDVRDGRVVKGTNFTNLKDVSDPVLQARIYSESGADELVFYDITASSENRRLIWDVLKNTAKNVFIPLTVGGGIDSLSDFDMALKCGADRVSVNSGAISNPELIKNASEVYGSQCVVLSIDAKRTESGFTVFSHGGRVETDLSVVEWAKIGESLGAGEIVLNSMDADGVKTGFDIEMLREVSEAVTIPVIASGGAGKKEDFLELFRELPTVDAGLAASVFHFGTVEIGDLKRYLSENGISMRTDRSGSRHD